MDGMFQPPRRRKFSKFVWVSIAGLAVSSQLPAAAHAGSGWKFWKRSAPSDTAQAPAETEVDIPKATEEVEELLAPPADILQTSAQIEPIPSTPNVAPDSESELSRLPLRDEIPPLDAALTPPAPKIGDNVMEVNPEAIPIDMATALQLVGVRNLDILIAQQRVLSATAQQQLAAAQALPNLNLGGNYDQHSGFFQQASGNVINSQRNSIFIGAGANAVAASAISIPGLGYDLNPTVAYYNYLVSKQNTERSMAANRVAHNDMVFEVASAYMMLVQAEAQRAILVKTRNEAAEISRVTKAFAESGQGRPADADRAASELAIQNADVYAAKANIAARSAQLVQLLNLEHSMELVPTDGWVIPRQIVPHLIPLNELIAIALYHRPEVAQQRAAVHAAMLELKSAKLLVFSPQVIARFSTGGFGGGSDLSSTAQTPRYEAPINQPRFGNFAARLDTDLIAYWSIRNLGLGNKGLKDVATAQLAANQWDQLNAMNQVRADVAAAYAVSQSRFAQLDILNQAVTNSSNGYAQDLARTQGGEGLPIELLNSLRLQRRAQLEYMQAIIEYNNSQYELYRALGQPPAALLMRPVETSEENPAPAADVETAPAAATAVPTEAKPEQPAASEKK